MNIIKLKNHNIIINILDNITLKEFGHIYLFKNKINNKYYIGQSIRVRDRISEHIQNVVNKKKYVLYNAINKYGLENFEFNIIDFANNINELNSKEINYIEQYRSNNRKFGYNIELGGRNALSTPETKQKLSDQRKGRKQNQEWINKRNLKISKVVLKIDRCENIVLEKFLSLADAGRNNKDNLSYQQISRKCLGNSKNDNNIYWCYEEDYLNCIIKPYKLTRRKQIIDFTEKELEIICCEYLEENISIEKLSYKYDMLFSTLNTYFRKRKIIC